MEKGYKTTELKVDGHTQRALPSMSIVEYNLLLWLSPIWLLLGVAADALQ